MSNFISLIRPHLLDIKPYSSARDEFKKNANDGANIQPHIFLDANENALGSVSKYFHNRYPDPLQWDIKKLLSEKLSEGCPILPTQIFLGNGSDEPIDLLIRLFCTPSHDKILTCPPTYGMYEVSANIHDVGIQEVILNEDFQLNIPEILNVLENDTQKNIKLVFLCSPNNPTGNVLKEQDILAILDQTNRKKSAMVVIDEAYIDFANNQYTWLNYLQKYENLVILRTFSKAWGLADIRLGMAFGHEWLISFLNKIKPPYNINQHTQELAVSALKQWHKKELFVRDLLEQRVFLVSELEKLQAKSIGRACPCPNEESKGRACPYPIEKIYPSDANFLLVKIKNANEVYQNLLKNGIVVRNRSHVKGCEDCLRITVGTFAENLELIGCLEGIVTQ